MQKRLFENIKKTLFKSKKAFKKGEKGILTIKESKML